MLGTNWLVSMLRIAKKKLVHFTLAGPSFESYAKCDFSEEWLHARDRMHFAKSF
jgi:hypothetical protein